MEFGREVGALCIDEFWPLSRSFLLLESEGHGRESLRRGSTEEDMSPDNLRLLVERIDRSMSLKLSSPGDHSETGDVTDDCEYDLARCSQNEVSPSTNQ